MIKILILFLVFIFLVFLLNTKNENFSNVNLKCGTLLRNLNASNLVNNSGVSASGGSPAIGGSPVSGNAASDGSAESGSAASGTASGGSNVSPNINTQLYLETVDPLLPECVGICINQHTYTTDNTRNIFIPNPEFITQRKSNQSDDTVMRTKCGECINNFYQGLILMKEQSSDCNL